MMNTDGTWEDLMDEVMSYARENQIDFHEDPFDGLLTLEEKKRIGEKILQDYMVAMDPKEREAAIQTYLSYGFLLLSSGAENELDKTELIDKLCNKTDELLKQYVHIDSKYNHKDFLTKPKSINEWLDYFNRYYPDLTKLTNIQMDSVESDDDSENTIGAALHVLAKKPTWLGLAFSMICQFVSEDECPDTEKDLYILKKPSGSELAGMTSTTKCIAGFVNWMDALCKESKKKIRANDDEKDIRILVMDMLGKCGFGESDQEGTIKTIQDFAIDVYNLTHEQQINKQEVHTIVCDYIMSFLAAVRKRSQGNSYAKAIAEAEDKFVNRCQLIGYGMLSLLKSSSKYLEGVTSLKSTFILVDSVDVDEWEERTYQFLFRARTVYLGYYIDLEKMDQDLEDDWQKLRTPIPISRGWGCTKHLIHEHKIIS